MAATHDDDEHRAKTKEKSALKAAQIELVKLQRHVIETDQKILVVLEGRDAAGKDGTIKRVVQHLSPRDARVVALGKNASWLSRIFSYTLTQARPER